MLLVIVKEVVKWLVTIVKIVKPTKENKMAVPKRRVSHTRAAKRRTHYKVTLPMPVKDKDGSWKMPHRVNPTTGQYK